MRKFLDELNVSDWKGAISEAGIGLDFSYQFVGQPGASNTVLDISSPYGSFDFRGRRVSLEAAEKLAATAFAKAVDANRLHYGHKNRNIFSIAMTGAHYEDRDTHAWACIMTTEWKAYIHYVIPTTPDRLWAGRASTEILMWFLEGCLLPKKSWLQHIADVPTGGYIDVLYAPGMGDAERLSLLTPTSALLYCDGKFHRVVDFLRDHDVILSGAFNPPHIGHQAVGKLALFELSQSNYTKGSASTGDMLHRLKMLDLMKRAVLVTQEPLFLKKDKVFKKYVDKKYTYRMGSDAWNLFVDHLPMPSETKGVMKFEVFDRTSWPARALPPPPGRIEVEFMDQVMDISSSEIRNEPEIRDKYLTPEVRDYIELHGLYT